MLTYSFTDRKKEGLYEYIYNCIKNDIVSGKLKAGEKLPSKRAFATNHGISVATVETAYAQLMAEGYIYSKPGSGFFVESISIRHNGSVNEASGNKSLTLPDIERKPTYADAHFPFSVWAKISRNLLTEQDAKLLTIPPSGGVMELREAITKHLLDFRGINVEPSQVIIGAGTEYLYGLIVQLFGRDKKYGLENPCSNKIRHIYKSHTDNVLNLPMDEDGVIVDSCQMKKADIIQISPSHQFPTGVVSSVNRRFMLLNWANEKEGRYIIEDDYDSEFRMLGKPIPALFSMDTSDKVVYFNTFTKSLTATIRISYMVLPKSLVNVFYKKLGFYACTVSNFEQYTLARFISEGHFEKHINRMRNRYKLLKELFVKELEKSKLADIVTISKEDAGLHFLLKINSDMDDLTLKQRALEKGVNLFFISDYYEYDMKPDKSCIDEIFNCGMNLKGVAIIGYQALVSDNMTDVEKKEGNVSAFVSALESAWG